MPSLRSEWFDFEGTAYLDTAAQGALPRVAVHAVQQALDWKKFPQRMPPETYFELPDRVRASVAKLIGGKPEEIAITTGASSGLAVVARSLESGAQHEVLIGKGEFPAHFLTFLPLAEAGKLRVKVVEPRGRFITADDFVEQIGPRTRLVSASLVRFDNGARLDAARLARACHQAGAWLLLDAAQCAGAMPIDVAELGADFVTASGYKWLLGPYGTGFFWARSDLIEQMGVGPVYWTAIEDASKFHSLSGGNFRLAPGARRWDSPETASFLNVSALDASLEFLLRIGVKTVWEHNRRLISETIARLPLDRFVLASPANEGERGPYFCVAARRPEATPAFHEQLRQAGVIVSLREGALRIAPHLFNSERDMDRLISVLSI